MLVFVMVPVTLCGCAGFSPYAYFSACFRISACRQCQSALLEIRVPSSFLNGSGSLAIAGSAAESGSAATVQSRRSSSLELTAGPQLAEPLRPLVRVAFPWIQLQRPGC